MMMKTITGMSMAISPQQLAELGIGTMVPGQRVRVEMMAEMRQDGPGQPIYFLVSEADAQPQITNATAEALYGPGPDGDDESQSEMQA